MSARPEVVPYQPTLPVTRALAYQLPNDQSDLPEWVRDWQQGRISNISAARNRPQRNSRLPSRVGSSGARSAGDRDMSRRPTGHKIAPRQPLPHTYMQQKPVQSLGNWNLTNVMDALNKTAQSIVAEANRTAQADLQLAYINELVAVVNPLIAQDKECYIKADGKGYDSLAELPKGCAAKWIVLSDKIDAVMLQPKYASLFSAEDIAAKKQMRVDLVKRAEQEAASSSQWKWLLAGGVIIAGIWLYRKYGK